MLGGGGDGAGESEVWLDWHTVRPPGILSVHLLIPGRKVVHLLTSPARYFFRRAIAVVDFTAVLREYLIRKWIIYIQPKQVGMVGWMNRGKKFAVYLESVCQTSFIHGYPKER